MSKDYIRREDVVEFETVNGDYNVNPIAWKMSDIKDDDVAQYMLAWHNVATTLKHFNDMRMVVLGKDCAKIELKSKTVGAKK